MTQSVPDKISPADLQELAEKAQKEEREEAKKEEKEEGVHGKKKLTDDQVITLANKYLDKMYDKLGGDPIVHKVAAMQVIHNLMRWHVHMSEAEAEDGSDGSAAAWAADAGRLKCALDIMRSVGLSSQDFTYRHDEDFKIFPDS